MRTRSGGAETSPKPEGLFATTHWSAVVAAGDAQSPRASKALEELCQAYWYPLYAYVRRQGHNPEDAQDLTQGFFARLVAKDYLSVVRPERGKFRWFLLSAINCFLENERQRALTEKRGGGAFHVPFDGERAEDRYRLEAADHLTPAKLYDRAWAVDLIEAANRSLEEECTLEGKAELFKQLKVCLSGDQPHLTYSELGARLRMTEGAVKVAVHRLRQRYREVLRERIAQTVTTRTEVDEELRDLLAAFSA
ncbi:MAG: RNA polymerase sigma factor [Verrucomicrobiia bacterium]